MRALIAAAVAALTVVAGAHAASAPVLGDAVPGTAGFGRAHPSLIAAGPGPTMTVTGVHWKRWGAKRATGLGKGWYLPPSAQSVADGQSATEKVVVFDLGTCKGKRAYLKLKWYFPGHGGSVRSSHANSTCL